MGLVRVICLFAVVACNGAAPFPTTSSRDDRELRAKITELEQRLAALEKLEQRVEALERQTDEKKVFLGR